jgi:hypothetical protein
VGDGKFNGGIGGRIIVKRVEPDHRHCPQTRIVSKFKGGIVDSRGEFSLNFDNTCVLGWRCFSCCAA